MIPEYLAKMFSIRQPRGGIPFDSGHLTQGNINLSNRPVVDRGDGHYSTVASGSYENNAGNEVLIPTVSNEGTIMPMSEAQRYWGLLGQNLGTFASPDQATAYALWLHAQQAKQYGGRR